ncbi:hypothetical protein AT4G18215, partial [Arabidopsis thaliana]
MMTARIGTTGSPKALIAFENREESSKISPVQPMENTCQASCCRDKSRPNPADAPTEGGRYSEEEKRIQNDRKKKAVKANCDAQIRERVETDKRPVGSRGTGLCLLTNDLYFLIPLHSRCGIPLLRDGQGGMWIRNTFMEMMSRFSFQKKTFAPQYWMAEEVTLLTAKMETAKWCHTHKIDMDASRPISKEVKPQIARIIEITFNPFILSWKMITAKIGTTGSPKTLIAFENREESSKISPVPPMENTCQ